MNKISKALMAGLMAGSLLTSSAFAADDKLFEMWPGTTYDASVPTYQRVHGYDIGDRVSWHNKLVGYFEALAKANPDRMKLWDYGKTWEGRRLIYVAISSKENIAKLDDISAGMKALADPRKTNKTAADKLIASLPGSTWISYAVHGNEISSGDAAMQTAYHLLAATNSEQVDNIMKNSVVFLDPMQNPDGRDRFVHNFEIAEGLEPDSDGIAAERNEPWPGGRTNHYLFDLNRDWFALTQPETQGKVRELQKWFPLTFVDAHEMGSNSSYYFAPEAIPFNPHIFSKQREALEWFGKNNAKYFDQNGWDYFTREVFDAFYPGYGASWPIYYGGVAMTYERGSSRGLKAKKADGKEFHYRETVQQHFVTSISTAEVTATNRVQMLKNFYDYRTSAIEEGKKEAVKTYILPAQNDMAAVNKMAGILSFQGIEVYESQNGFAACGTKYAAGSYVISAAQPSKRFIRTIMDVDVPMEKDFLAKQEKRRARNLRDEIYDVTAWSLPQLYNVDMDTCNKQVKLDNGFTMRGDELVRAGAVTGAGTGAKVGYLVAWKDVSSVKLLSAALRAGIDVKSTDLKFTHMGKQYPSGTLIIKNDTNEPGLGAKLAKMAAHTGAEVVGVDDSWVTSGPNFGSNNVGTIVAPKVGILWDDPTASYAAGNTKFVIERQLGYPVTSVRTAALRYSDMANYDVLIMVGQGRRMGYEAFLGKAGINNLKSWVRRGGVLIAMDSALNFLSDPDVGLLAVQRENQLKSEAILKNAKDAKKGAVVAGREIKSAGEFATLIEPSKERPDNISGIIAAAQVDPDHWMSAGLPASLNVLVRGSNIYTPIKLDKGRNTVYFKGPDEVLAGGYMWDENRRQMAYKPFVINQPTGRGQVIAFTQDPTVRAYLDGLNLVMANAIFRGVQHARPTR